MPFANYEHTQVGNGPWKWGVMTHANTKQSVAALLWTLHDLGGTITDGSGLAAAKLAEMAAKRGMPLDRAQASGAGLSTLMGSLDHGRMAGCIERETNGKRTKKITLLLEADELPPRPQPQRSLLVQAVPDPIEEPVADGGTGPRPEEPDTPEPEPIPAPPGRPEDPNLTVVTDEPVTEPVEPVLPPLAIVADDDPMSMLLKIQSDLMDATISVAAMGAPVIVEVEQAPVDNTIAERLAATLEENNRLRRQVNEARETAVARAKENEGLRKQILVAQNNLRKLQEASVDASKRERDLARLRGNQQFISARPEAAIAARR